MPEITPLTPARVAIVDPATGGVTRPWYMFFQSLYQSAQNAVLNYIGAVPPSDGQLLRYDAASQGWTNSVGLEISSVGDIISRGNLSILSQDPPTDYRAITVDGQGYGSFLLLVNSNSGGLTDTSFLADDSGLAVVSPNIDLISGGDVQIAASNINVFRLSGSNGFLSLSTGSPPTPTAQLDINNNTIRLRNNRTPASATASGNKGDICWDTSYIYVCVATNTWKRTAISTW